MNWRILTPRERKNVVEDIGKRFGIVREGMWIETGREKLRLFSGNVSQEDLQELREIARIEIIGLYFARAEKDGLRLSFDAPFFLNSPKSVLEISSAEVKEWMRGNDIKKECASGVYILMSGTDFVGCGVSDGTTVHNFVPKERRVRKG